MIETHVAPQAPTTVAIRPASGAPKAVPTRSVDSGPVGCLRPFWNEQLNSRAGVKLGAGKWSSVWTAQLLPESRPLFLLTAGDRILVQERTRWQLLDLRGERIAYGAVGHSDCVLDPANGLFYASAKSGLVAARRLSDGGDAFSVFAQFGEMFRRTYIARRGERLIFAGVERSIDPHDHVPPNRSMLESQTLGAPLALHASGLVTNSETRGVLNFETLDLFAALGGRFAAVATPDRIEIADLDLRVQRVLTGSFKPLALSMDELDHLHLLARSGDRTVYWQITAEGERTSARELPSAPLDPPVPPMVGNDHRVHLALRDRVLTLDPRGEPDRTYRPPGAIVGAAVTADDRLVMVSGNQVLAVDATGQATTLYTTQERLVTPPSFTASGRLLVASAGALYVLESR
ncbi:MAG: hypothetical protein IT581_08680 [Verrucomicrobiales bacterium]|nr:hypothetical protein [Verrucomicrobiales bacterium]